MNKTTDNNSQTIQNDDIDLRELFIILKKRKKLIASVTVLLTLLALIYAFFIAKPVYEVKSNVQIGYIGEDLIVNANTLTKKLNLVFSGVSSITSNKRLENFIEIKTQARSNEEALKKNKEVVKYIQDLYQEKIDHYILTKNYSIRNSKREISDLGNFQAKDIEGIRLQQMQKIARIDEKIKFYKNIKLVSIKTKIKFHTEKLKAFTQAVNALYQSSKKISDAALLAISSMQMVHYQDLILNSQNQIEDLKIEREIIHNETIVDLQREKESINHKTIRELDKVNTNFANKKIKLEEKILQLNYDMSKQNMNNSRVAGEHVVKNKPKKPKKKLIVIVAFITGLMLSVFLAFFLEFIGNMRKEEEEN